MIITSIITIIPAVLYSGLLLPLSSLSPGASLIAHSLPPMYYGRIVTDCFLKGAGAAELWPDALVLAGYAVGLFAIGYLLFSKRPKS